MLVDLININKQKSSFFITSNRIITTFNG